MILLFKKKNALISTSLIYWFLTWISHSTKKTHNKKPPPDKQQSTPKKQNKPNTSAASAKFAQGVLKYAYKYAANKIRASSIYIYHKIIILA